MPNLAERIAAIDFAAPGYLIDSDDQAAEIREQCLSLLAAGQYAQLEQMAATFSDPGQRLADGRWRLDVFYSAFTQALADDVPGNSFKWTEHLPCLDRWRSTMPSAVATTTWAEASLAWSADQAQNASVSDEHQAILECLYRLPKDDGDWHRDCVLLRLLRDVSEGRLVFDRAIGAKLGYLPVFRDFSLLLLMRGARRLLRDFVLEAAATQPVEGAALLVGLDQFIGPYLSTLDDAWPALRLAYLDHLARFPNQATLAQLAQRCHARDDLDLARRLEIPIMQLPDAYWNGVSYDNFRDWLDQPFHLTVDVTAKLHKVDAFQPHASAVTDHHRSQRAGNFFVIHTDGLATPIPSSHSFHSVPGCAAIDAQALSLCRGKILDIGAGAGQHSLALQAHGHDVTAMDANADAVALMKQRGVQRVLHSRLETMEGQYQTLLLLGHTVGMAGRIADLPALLAQLERLLLPGGVVLLVSHFPSPALPNAEGIVRGEHRWQLHYRDQLGEPFWWCYPHPDQLIDAAQEVGMRGEIICQEADGNYLARLVRADDRQQFPNTKLPSLARVWVVVGLIVAAIMFATYFAELP